MKVIFFISLQVLAFFLSHVRTSTGISCTSDDVCLSYQKNTHCDLTLELCLCNEFYTGATCSKYLNPDLQHVKIAHSLTTNEYIAVILTNILFFIVTLIIGLIIIFVKFEGKSQGENIENDENKKRMEEAVSTLIKSQSQVAKNTFVQNLLVIYEDLSKEVESAIASNSKSSLLNQDIKNCSYIISNISAFFRLIDNDATENNPTADKIVNELKTLLSVLDNNTVFFKPYFQHASYRQRLAEIAPSHFENDCPIPSTQRMKIIDPRENNQTWNMIIDTEARLLQDNNNLRTERPERMANSLLPPSQPELSLLKKKSVENIINVPKLFSATLKKSKESSKITSKKVSNKNTIQIALGKQLSIESEDNNKVGDVYLEIANKNKDAIEVKKPKIAEEKDEFIYDSDDEPIDYDV